MGIDYQATTIFGLKVPKTALMEQVAHPGCEHSHNSKFCPECGKPAKRFKDVPIKGWDGYEFAGLDTVSPGYESDEVIIGIALGHATESRNAFLVIGTEGLPINFLTELNEKLWGAIDAADSDSPLNDKKFPAGLWTVLSAG